MMPSHERLCQVTLVAYQLGAASPKESAIIWHFRNLRADRRAWLSLKYRTFHPLGGNPHPTRHVRDWERNPGRSRGEETMAETKKCGNPPCDCVPSDGEKYCSAYCEGAEERTDVVCHCGHVECEGDVVIAPQSAAQI